MIAAAQPWCPRDNQNRAATEVYGVVHLKPLQPSVRYNPNGLGVIQKRQHIIDRLDSFERVLVRVAYTISLIVMVIILITVELHQVAQVFRMVIGTK